VGPAAPEIRHLRDAGSTLGAASKVPQAMNGRTISTPLPWSDEAVRQLRQLAQHQLSAREIAKRIGRSEQAIKRKGRTLGLTLR